MKATVRVMFYLTRDSDEVERIVRDGFVCTHSDSDDRNLLGPSEYGFQFVKHADVALLYEYFCKTRSFYVILTRVSLFLLLLLLLLAKIEEIYSRVLFLNRFSTRNFVQVSRRRRIRTLIRVYKTAQIYLVRCQLMNKRLRIDLKIHW